MVHATQAKLGAYEGMTVSVAAPADSVGTAAADPILKERWSVRKAFTVDPMTVGGGGLVAALGLGGVAFLVLRKGRDKQYVGEIPGLAPVDGVGTDRAGAAVGPHPGRRGVPAARRASPRAGRHPARRAVDPLDVTATIVDLAVHGYLRIEEQERAHWFAGRDWRLVQLSAD